MQFGTIIFLNYWDLSEVNSFKLELRARLNHYVKRLLFSVKRASIQWLLGKFIERWITQAGATYTRTHTHTHTHTQVAYQVCKNYRFIGSRPDTSHQCRHPRWTVCPALNLFCKQEYDAVAYVITHDEVSQPAIKHRRFGGRTLNTS